MKVLNHILNLLLKPITFFKNLSFKRKLLAIGIFLIVFIIFKSITGGHKEGFTTVKAAKSTITETVSETGSITVNGRTTIYSPTSGTVEEVFIKNGDTVEAGQELLTIKSSANEQEKSQARANYLAAKNGFDAANSGSYSLRSAKDLAWKRYYELATSDEYQNSDGSPKQDLRNSSAEFQAAQGDWLAAEANYKQQTSVISQGQAALSSTYLLYQLTQDTTVKATTAGTVSNLSVTARSTVAANLPTVPSSPLITIANFATTELVISLSENEIVKIKEGQSATVEVNAINNKTYRGTVKRVDSIGSNDNGVMRYNVYILIENPDDNLRHGMNAEASITTNKYTDVLSVPNSAVKPYKGGRAVRVPGKNGKVEYLPVEIGIRGKDKTQITKGLKEGQIIITVLSNDQIKKSGMFGN